MSKISQILFTFDLRRFYKESIYSTNAYKSMHMYKRCEDVSTFLDSLINKKQKSSEGNTKCLAKENEMKKFITMFMQSIRSSIIFKSFKV